MIFNTKSKRNSFDKNASAVLSAAINFFKENNADSLNEEKKFHKKQIYAVAAHFADNPFAGRYNFPQRNDDGIVAGIFYRSTGNSHTCQLQPAIENKRKNLAKRGELHPTI